MRTIEPTVSLFKWEAGAQVVGQGVGKVNLKSSMTSSFWLATKSKETAQPQIVPSLDSDKVTRSRETVWSRT